MPGIRSLICIAALTAIAVPTVADVAEPALRVEAVNDLGTGVFEVPLSAMTYDPAMHWYTYQGAGIDIETTQGTKVAELSEVSITLVDENQFSPRIVLNYNVQAGPSETLFTVTPGQVSFPTISAGLAEAVMSWTFVAADNPESGDSHIKMQGAPQGEDIYRAWYNTGTQFGNSATLLEAEGTPPPPLTITLSDTIPSYGTMPLGVGVDSIASETSFTLTPLDDAQVQTAFGVIPEPATLALLAVGTLVLMGRRR